MKNINEELSAFSCSDDFYAHPSGRIFSEGVKYLADKYECCWLIDAIVSHQTKNAVRAEPFQTWTLKRTNGDSFVLVGDDGNGNKFAAQLIKFSDFKGDQITLYLEGRVLILPSEH
jgi:hypothetical protein